MNKDIKQLPKEINKIIDFYIPYKELVSIPLNRSLFYHLTIRGVYILYSRSAILYIGCSINIGLRLMTHSSDGDYGNKIKRIYIIRVPRTDDSMELEAKLIDAFKPIYNKSNNYLYSYYPPSSIDFIGLIKKIKKELGIE